MGTPPLPDDVIAETVAAYIASGRNQVATSSALGISRGAVQDRLKMAARRGMLGTSPVITGFEIAKISTRENADGDITSTQIQQRPERGEEFQVPDGHTVKGVSAYLDADGRTVSQWVKTAQIPLDPEALADRLIAKYDKMTFAVPIIPPPAAMSDDYLNFFPMGDLHFGVRVSGRETGGEDWGLAKAASVYRDSFGALMARVSPAKKCILAIGGDSTHQDNRSNRTPGSGHPLDVDGSYIEAVEIAADFIVDSAVLAAQKHEEVEIDLICGNHDPHSIVGIAGFLRGVFRENDRIKVNMPYDPFSVHRHGLVMLALTHGDMAKPKQMPGIMAARWSKIWGATKYRYAHCFHVHHKEKIKDELGGAYVETYQSPAPQDAWHYGMGFLSGRSFEAVTYHSETGWRGNLVEPIG